MTKEEILKGIAAYQDAQNYLLRAIDDAGGSLHQDAFDALFRIDRFLETWYSFDQNITPDSFILGSFHSPSPRDKMLQLAQLMAEIGLIEIAGEEPDIVYLRQQKLAA